MLVYCAVIPQHLDTLSLYETRFISFLATVQFSFSVFAEPLTSYEPAPSQWKTEIIKLPFDFAPQITLTGSEELVFAPGMYKARAPDFLVMLFHG